MKEFEAKLLKIIKPEQLKKNVNLKDYHTFRIDTFAKCVVLCTNQNELEKTLQLLNEQKLQYILLGNGSNVIFRHKLVKKIIVICTENIIKSYKGKQGVYFTVFSGTKLKELVALCQRFGVSGLEWANGIPASVGGATRMNAGAYGSCIGDYVQSVKAYKNGKITRYSKSRCKFGYRNSIFANNPIAIIEIKLMLPYGNKDSINLRMNTYITDRLKKQPLGLPNAGSVFKNTSAFPAGWFIEHAGLKGAQIGGAMVSQKHANFIVNTGNATYSDIIKLITKIQKTVYEKFSVHLEQEIVVID